MFIYDTFNNDSSYYHNNDYNNQYLVGVCDSKKNNLPTSQQGRDFFYPF
jgi:hypothetical protein